MPSYNAQIIPKSSVPNGHIREHCSAQRSQILTIGRNKGQQVRIERYAPEGLKPLDFALYTVIDVHDEEPDVERLTDNGRHRGLIAIAPHSGDIERHTDE